MWFDLKGDARLGRCTTEGCGGQPTFRLESGGVGSDYCSGCRAAIEKPHPMTDREETLREAADWLRNHDAMDAEGYDGSTGDYIAAKHIRPLLALIDSLSAPAPQGSEPSDVNSCEAALWSDNMRLRSLLEWFCSRVDAGEIRSKQTYARFKTELDGAVITIRRGDEMMAHEEAAREWKRQIINAGGAENVAQQAVTLAALNGLFDIYRSAHSASKALWECTDAEIAHEHHIRMRHNLGDQTVGVSIPIKPGIG